MTHLEIEAFLSVIKYGSITKASEKLFVTQPALSRRIRSLEMELGYQLIIRQKGIRTIELTEAGRDFIPIAEKWQILWSESQNLHQLDHKVILNVASADSVSTYIMLPVYYTFLQSETKTKLVIRTLHYSEAYQYVEDGTVDIAFAANARYSRRVDTIPAFRESMRMVCAAGSGYPLRVHPSMLDVKNEIKLPWNSEYERWHEYWYGATVQPLVILDKMSYMEQFIRLEHSWAMVPASAANRLRDSKAVEIHDMEEGPPDRIIYYLLGEKRKPEPMNRFLNILDSSLKDTKGIYSLL